jgi:hypothetical protein
MSSAPMFAYYAPQPHSAASTNFVILTAFWIYFPTYRMQSLCNRPHVEFFAFLLCSIRGVVALRWAFQRLESFYLQVQQVPLLFVLCCGELVNLGQVSFKE